MQILLEQLIRILKLLKVKPSSGFGQTVIEWKNNEIYLITITESYRPKDIN